MPTLATRGAGNALKATLTDMTCTRLETITMNTEHAQNVISAVSSALTTSSKREETTEVREGGSSREERRGTQSAYQCYELQIINLHSSVVDNYLYIRGIMLVYSLNIYLSGTGSGGT